MGGSKNEGPVARESRSVSVWLVEVAQESVCIVEEKLKATALTCYASSPIFGLRIAVEEHEHIVDVLRHIEIRLDGLVVGRAPAEPKGFHLFPCGSGPIISVFHSSPRPPTDVEVPIDRLVVFFFYLQGTGRACPHSSARADGIAPNTCR